MGARSRGWILATVIPHVIYSISSLNQLQTWLCLQAGTDFYIQYLKNVFWLWLWQHILFYWRFRTVFKAHSPDDSDTIVRTCYEITRGNITGYTICTGASRIRTSYGIFS